MKSLQNRKVEILKFLEKPSKNLVVSELYNRPVTKPSSSILSFFSLQDLFLSNRDRSTQNLVNNRAFLFFREEKITVEQYKKCIVVKSLHFHIKKINLAAGEFLNYTILHESTTFSLINFSVTCYKGKNWINVIKFLLWFCLTKCMKFSESKYQRNPKTNAESVPPVKHIQVPCLTHSSQSKPIYWVQFLEAGKAPGVSTANVSGKLNCFVKTF